MRSNCTQRKNVEVKSQEMDYARLIWNPFFHVDILSQELLLLPQQPLECRPGDLLRSQDPLQCPQSQSYTHNNIKSLFGFLNLILSLVCRRVFMQENIHNIQRRISTITWGRKPLNTPPFDSHISGKHGSPMLNTKAGRRMQLSPIKEICKK